MEEELVTTIAQLALGVPAALHFEACQVFSESVTVSTMGYGIWGIRVGWGGVGLYQEA